MKANYSVQSQANCKTVNTSSILVVASNKINDLDVFIQTVFSASVFRQSR
jgi:hypothetical protein